MNNLEGARFDIIDDIKVFYLPKGRNYSFDIIATAAGDYEIVWMTANLNNNSMNGLCLLDLEIQKDNLDKYEIESDLSKIVLESGNTREYDIAFSSIRSNNCSVFFKGNNSIAYNQTLELTIIDWENLNNSEEAAVLLQIDVDGDGDFDITEYLISDNAEDIVSERSLIEEFGSFILVGIMIICIVAISIFFMRKRKPPIKKNTNS